jgi:hypothetical protein
MADNVQNMFMFIVTHSIKNILDFTETLYFNTVSLIIYTRAIEMPEISTFQ